MHDSKIECNIVKNSKNEVKKSSFLENQNFVKNLKNQNFVKNLKNQNFVNKNLAKNLKKNKLINLKNIYISINF